MRELIRHELIDLGVAAVYLEKFKQEQDQLEKSRQ